MFSGADKTFTVHATEVIFLAGRTDITIPEPGVPDPNYPLLRNLAHTTKDRFPTKVVVTGGESFHFYGTSGQVDYWGGVFGGPSVYPTGVLTVNNVTVTSNLNSVGDISGYESTSGGALVGVFLTDAIPNGNTPPAPIESSKNSSSSLSTSPAIGQIFYIGNGALANLPVTYTAPAGATALYIGIADGGNNFQGQPGFYGDNSGSFSVNIYKF